MNQNPLEQIGLTPEQSSAYRALVRKGSLPARKVATEGGLSRPLAYKVLGQLVALGLVAEESSPGKPLRFSAKHPSNLAGILEHRAQELRLAEQALDEAVRSLGSEFTLTCGKPATLFYEGIEGVRALNRDILATGAPVSLVRSPLDNDTEDLDRLAKKLVADRAAAGIKTRLIVPIKNTPSSIAPGWDAEHLIERRRVPRAELHNPAQVAVYGSKVAFTSFGGCLVTTIVEDAGIAKTCQMLFDALWEKYSANAGN